MEANEIFFQLECEVLTNPSVSISPNNITTCEFLIKDSKGIERKVSTVEENAIYAYTNLKKGSIISIDALSIFCSMDYKKNDKIIASTIDIICNSNNKFKEVLKDIELKARFFFHSIFVRQRERNII